MGKKANGWEKFRDMGQVSPDLRASLRDHRPALRLHIARIMDVISHSDRRPGYHGVSHADEFSRMVAVPAVEWHVFLERFSRRHRGWLATLHGFERGLPVTRVGSERLEAVGLERADFDHLIRMTFANGVSLCAPRPRAVRVQQTDEGAEAALEVETASGAFIRLAFRATALPDQLDGVAPAEVSTDRRTAH